MRHAVTLKDVAEKVGCSVALVSVVLSGRENSRIVASAEMKGRITSAAKELGYEPNRVARGLRLHRNFLIGVLAYNLSSSFVPEILSGIESRCLHTNYGILLGAYGNEEELTERWTSLVRRGVDGIIVIGASETRAPAVVTLNPSIPRVFIGGLFPLQNAGRVRGNRRMVQTLASEALFSRGHRRIGYLTNRQPETCGFWKECMERGKALKSVIVHCANAWQEGIEVARKLLTSHPDITGIFADSDILGAAVLSVARERGISVPEQLSVIGVDDSLLCQTCYPPLASVHQARREQGEKAAELLMSMLDGMPPHEYVLDSELVVRKSLGVCKK